MRKRSGMMATRLVMAIALLVGGTAFCAGADATRHDPATGATRAGSVSPSYVVVDTAETACYDAYAEIPCPQKGAAYYGQDAQHEGNQPSYVDNGDGTITDLNTGLMWQKTPDLENKSTWTEAMAGASSFRLAGYDDWRLPTIKELYSLIEFTGHTFVDAASSRPYIDTSYFDFVYGDTSAGYRFIDAQYWSSTAYVGTTMNDASTAFGVNFADGRIKGYPTGNGKNGTPFKAYARYVRGNPEYGVNHFVDNGDGTITDLATGLMWTRADSGKPMNWPDALAYAQSLETGGHDDWRLPNAKELQSIVDYTRAPDAVDPSQRATAIDPIFEVGDPEAWYWSSTTHLDGPDARRAAYVAFGRAMGWMEEPPGSGSYVLLDVHGAGAQRSDPKTGSATDYPHGFGPQGDVIRIDNYVRCVRDASATSTTSSRKRGVRRP